METWPNITSDQVNEDEGEVQGKITEQARSSYKTLAGNT